MGLPSSVQLQVDVRGVATLMLDRPEKHNALDADLIEALHAAVIKIGSDPHIRVVVLAGAGKSFCAGADLAHMRRMATAPADENARDALALAACLHAVANLGPPVLARVHGNVFGGGVGLVCCADIAIAASQARFCLSEVRLGLAPAVISPFLLASIGQRQMGRLMLTAASIDAAQALAIGLIHRHVDAAELDEAVEQEVGLLLQGAPQAQRSAKRLLRELAGPNDAEREASSARHAAELSRLRAAPEGVEGLRAFLEKRKPGWG